MIFQAVQLCFTQEFRRETIVELPCSYIRQFSVSNAINNRDMQHHIIAILQSLAS